MNETPIAPKEYRVYSGNLFALREKLAKLNKRAFKLGGSPITLVDTGRFEDEQIKNDLTGIVVDVRRFHFMTVTGESPKFNGWSLGAVVEHTTEGNILRKAPNVTAELTQFRVGAQHCDHCKQARHRIETFVVIHDSGEQKLVGRNCLRDFLGHQNPNQLASLAEIVFSVGEMCEASENEGYGYGGERLFYVDGFLAYSACAVRHLGYVTSKRARESQETGGNVCSTRQTAEAWSNPFKGAKLGVDYFRPEDCDIEAASKAKQHVLDTLGAKEIETLSDFEHSLLVVCKCEAINPKSAGILAYVPEYYARAIQQAKESALEAYFGEVGKRMRNIPLTYIKSTGFDSVYGYTYIHTFTTLEGARILWKSGTNVDVTNGAQINATFTIKAHEEWKGHKQTKVSRLTV